MQHFEVGDLVLLINASYNPDIIGHVGTVMHSEDHFAGFDKFGRYISGNYVVVDLPDDVNRHGTTLWYLKPKHLIRITPDNLSETETTETLIAT
ncbi:MAG: hypothetical protein ACE1Z4_03225 [Gammaproteobacteria bacterium]|nr:hypothetical protein [Gammaproteobacteria bacterium]